MGLALAVALSATGCGAARRSGAESAPRAAPELRASPATEARVDRTIVTPERAVGIDELFAEADLAFAEGRFVVAARKFERVAELDPDGRLAAAALHRAAVSYDEAGELALAADCFERAYRRHPASDVAPKALVRAVRVLVYLERWARAGELAAAAIEFHLPALSERDRIALFSARALERLAADDTERAAYFVEKGRSLIEARGLHRAAVLPRDLAPLYFALGEVRRQRGERIVLSTAPGDFSVELERRCQLLLDAQSAYADAMRARDAHWSAMAGFRVGELYQRLHGQLMEVPAPARAVRETQRSLFEGAMRLRYSVLLSKGMTMMKHTLEMAERTGERSEWVERARDASRGLERSLEDEERALARLPYTRAELQRALDDLGRRAASRP